MAVIARQVTIYVRFTDGVIRSKTFSVNFDQSHGEPVSLIRAELDTGNPRPLLIEHYGSGAGEMLWQQAGTNALQWATKSPGSGWSLVP